MRAILFFLLAAIPCLRAASPVYVLLWFDTEDYIEPAADDAALRIAKDLTGLGVRATFKVVGEKARVLEQRGRRDVTQALALHDIGYHSNFHSMQPTPALYLRDLGYLEGVAEFQRRESPGLQDVMRIFGTRASCYGQPGSSWGPQSMAALRRMGIPVYLDEGTHVGIHDQPFWYGGLLHVFNMGHNQLRVALDSHEPLETTFARFDEAATELRKKGGGVISIYYHPTEFVTTEFWDVVNFAKGANPERAEWHSPHRRTDAESTRCFTFLHNYVAHVKGVPDVRFVTAHELPELYEKPTPSQVDRAQIATTFAARQTFLETPTGVLSAADMLLELLGMEPQFIEGPTSRQTGTFDGKRIGRPAWERAKADVVSSIKANQQLPAVVWIGSRTLTIGDFAASLAADDGKSDTVNVHRANLEFEKYISKEPQKVFDWPIHPDGFSAPGLLELARLQGWTLKPAHLRQ